MGNTLARASFSCNSRCASSGDCPAAAQGAAVCLKASVGGIAVGGIAVGGIAPAAPPESTRIKTSKSTTNRYQGTGILKQTGVYVKVLAVSHVRSFGIHSAQKQKWNRSVT
jgi:hypothetical protein